MMWILVNGNIGMEQRQGALSEPQSEHGQKWKGDEIHNGTIFFYYQQSSSA